MAAIQVHRWTREEYERMAEAGVFEPGKRVELLDGEIFEMTPQGSYHVTAVLLIQLVLQRSVGDSYVVRTQFPLALDPLSEPEPDVAVVAGTPRDFVLAHPASALLAVGVADTTLAHDRERKGSLHARAGILDYWIVNLVDRCLEVYRDPEPSPDTPYGWRCRSVERYVTGQSVSPLAFADVRILVADLLP